MQVKTRTRETVEGALRDPMIPAGVKGLIREAIEASQYPLTHVDFEIVDGGAPCLFGPSPFTCSVPQEGEAPTSEVRSQPGLKISLSRVMKDRMRLAWGAKYGPMPDPMRKLLE